MGTRAASLLLGSALLVATLAGCSDDAPRATPTTAPVEPSTPSTAPPSTRAPLLDAGSAPPALPRPAALPTDPWAPTPDVVIGTIEIPAIGLRDQLHEGMTLTAINRGPSAWPGTAEPGGLGNLVIGGHRTTWSAPFADLDRLTVGDEMILTTDDGRHVYRVTGSDIVDPNATHIALQTYGHTATLFACHPKGSAAQRIVVRLELVGDDGVAVDDSTDWDLAAPPVTPATSEGQETDVPADEATDPLTFSDG